MNPILKAAVHAAHEAHEEAIEKARYGAAGSSKQRRTTAMLNRMNRQARGKEIFNRDDAERALPRSGRRPSSGLGASFYREWLGHNRPTSGNSGQRNKALQGARAFLNRAAERKGLTPKYRRGLFSSKLKQAK